MTVRLGEIPYSELHPTIRALSDAGMDAELARLIRQKGGGERAVAAIRREFFPESRTVITFTVAGRRYEAVPFLNHGEKSVDGNTMVARTEGENGGGLGQEEGNFLGKHRSELPEELRFYHLVFTKWRISDLPRHVLFFVWNADRWCQDEFSLDVQWRGHFLVLRRCT